MATLAGIGAGGAVGGITGGLIGMGIPEYEAKRYEGRVKKAGILVSVHSDNADWTKKAKDVLERTGEDDISSTGEASADFAKSDRPAPRMAAEGRVSSADSATHEADYEPEYRSHYQTTYGRSGSPLRCTAPAIDSANAWPDRNNIAAGIFRTLNPIFGANMKAHIRATRRR